jgi:hypothetical protein
LAMVLFNLSISSSIAARRLKYCWPWTLWFPAANRFCRIRSCSFTMPSLWFSSSPICSSSITVRRLPEEAPDGWFCRVPQGSE